MKRYYMIDAEALIDSELSAQEWMILENIHFLSTETGWCYASKKLLAKHHGLGERAYQKIRSKLHSSGWLKINTKGHLKTTKKWFNLQANKSSDESNYDANKSSDDMRTKVPTLPIKKELKRDNRPKLEEIVDYISEKKLSVDANKFFEYFEAGNWIDAKGNRVKNWKQKLLTWDSHSSKKEDNVDDWSKYARA